MLTRKLVLTGCAVFVVALLGASSTMAWSSFSGANHLRFGASVALPGVVLSPGTYTFEAGPQETNAQIVRVTTRDGRRTLFMGFTIPVSRPDGNRRPGVSLGEAPAGQPRPVIVWYPSGSATGHQFQY